MIGGQEENLGAPFMVPGTVAGRPGRNLDQVLSDSLWGYKSIVGYGVGVFNVDNNAIVASGVVGIRNPGSGRKNYAHPLRRINGTSPIKSAQAIINERRTGKTEVLNVAISFHFISFGKLHLIVEGRGLEPKQPYTLVIREYGDWSNQGNVFNPTLYANGSGGTPLMFFIGEAGADGTIQGDLEVAVNLNGWDSIVGRSVVLHESKSRPTVASLVGSAVLAITSFTELFAPPVVTAAPNMRSSEPPPEDLSWLDKRYKDNPGLTVFLAILGLMLSAAVLLFLVLCLRRYSRRKRAEYSGDITAEVDRQRGSRSNREIELERRLEREMIESRA